MVPRVIKDQELADLAEGHPTAMPLLPTVAMHQ